LGSWDTLCRKINGLEIPWTILYFGEILFA
jgi:hypothetical protein